MQPPQVDAKDGVLTGWPEFNEWASRNLLIWNAVTYHSAQTKLDTLDTARLLAYMLALEGRRMMDANIKRMQETGTPNF